MPGDAARDSPTPFSAVQLLGRLGRLARKELREILRDRRTIVTLVLMPILVYPMIGVTFQKFLASQLTQTPRVEYRPGFRTFGEAQQFTMLLHGAERFAAQQEGRPFDPNSHHYGTEDDPDLVLVFPDQPTTTFDLDVLLRDRDIDVGVVIADGGGDAIKVEFVTEDRSAVGRNAQRYLEDRLRPLNEAFFERELKRVHRPFHPPVTFSVRTLSVPQEPSHSLAMVVPLILILMTVTGAVYPAIDLTAGERERGTLEALISAPVPRRELLLAKYVAVLTVALLTAIANLIAMTATAYITGLQSLLFGRDGLSPLLVLEVFGVLAVFAAFFSSILLAVTSFARSFKEAQAYLIPVMLVSIAPGILALMPGLRLSYGLALTPLANMVLVTRDLFDRQLEGGPTAVALAATLVYTVIGIVLAARIFGTDAVLYGSSGSWSDAWRRPAKAGTQPSPAQVLGCLAVILPAFLFFGRVLATWVETSLDAWLIGQLCLTGALFVGLPAATARWKRIPLRAAFQWRRAPALSWLGAVLAGLSLWPFAYEAMIFLLPAEQIRELMEKFAGLEARLASIPFGVRLLVFAVAPAVTEELFFRGYLLQGLARGWGRWPAILASGAIFGAFHVFVQGLSFERFPPTTLLGFCLGWICLRTGSVRPGMLLHVLHNAFLLSISESAELLKSLGIGVEQQTHLPAWWLVVSGGMAFTSWLIFLRLTPKQLPAVQPAG